MKILQHSSGLYNNESGIQEITRRVKEKKLQRVVIFGIGSSYTAGMIAAPMFRYQCSLPTHILPATEMDSYGGRLVGEHTLVVVVSRTGEREWVIKALEKSISYGALGVAMDRRA